MSGLDDTRCNYCKEHGFRHPNLCEDCRASATPADVGEEPVAWGVFRDGKMVAWVPGGGTEFKLPEDTDERRPLYSATALERVARERDEARARIIAAWNAFAGEVATDYDDTIMLVGAAAGDLDEQIDELTRQRNSAEAKLAEARKVIEPFAARAGKLDGIWRDHETTSMMYGNTGITVGDLRAARRFLEETK